MAGTVSGVTAVARRHIRGAHEGLRTVTCWPLPRPGLSSKRGTVTRRGGSNGGEQRRARGQWRRRVRSDRAAARPQRAPLQRRRLRGEVPRPHHHQRRGVRELRAELRTHVCGCTARSDRGGRAGRAQQRRGNVGQTRQQRPPQRGAAAASDRGRVQRPRRRGKQARARTAGRARVVAVLPRPRACARGGEGRLAAVRSRGDDGGGRTRGCASSAASASGDVAATHATTRRPSPVHAASLGSTWPVAMRARRHASAPARCSAVVWRRKSSAQFAAADAAHEPPASRADTTARVAPGCASSAATVPARPASHAQRSAVPPPRLTSPGPTMPHATSSPAANAHAARSRRDVPNSAVLHAAEKADSPSGPPLAAAAARPPGAASSSRSDKTAPARAATAATVSPAASVTAAAILPPAASTAATRLLELVSAAPCRRGTDATRPLPRGRASTTSKDSPVGDEKARAVVSTGRRLPRGSRRMRHSRRRSGAMRWAACAREPASGEPPEDARTFRVMRSCADLARTRLMRSVSGFLPRRRHRTF